MDKWQQQQQQQRKRARRAKSIAGAETQRQADRRSWGCVKMEGMRGLWRWARLQERPGGELKLGLAENASQR